MSDPVKSVKEQLVDMLNASLVNEGIEAEYTVADVTFGEVTPYDEGTYDPTSLTGHNTSVVGSVGEFLEQVDFRLHYTRYNLHLLAGLRPHEFAADAEATSTYDVLAEINEHLKVELTEDDLVDELIEDGVVTLKAKPTSLQVFGETQLTIEGSAPQARVASFSVPSDIGSGEGEGEASGEQSSSETTPPPDAPSEGSEPVESTDGEGESSDADDAEQA